MPSRRNFLKSTLLSGSFLLPGVVKRWLEIAKKENELTGIKPLFISTWNHGLAANQKAWNVLKDSGSILDAVEEGVKVTEADIKSRSVGLTGYPDRDGYVTLDASIMDSRGDCGSVCFVQRIKHPITLARKVMEETPHVMLAGEGAEQFAVSHGMPLETVPMPEDVRETFEEWKETSEYKPEINNENHDTIGLIGIDSGGNLAGSCTTSGLKFKMHGRVGDSPIIGAGLYVDNEVGAATATGFGESIIKICGSYLIIELMRQGRNPQQACEEAVDRLLQKTQMNPEDIQVGFIAIDKRGAYGAYSVQPGFTYAIHHENGHSIEESDSYYKANQIHN